MEPCTAHLCSMVKYINISASTGQDEYTLDNFTYESQGSASSTVPTPPTLPLFATGLGLMALLQSLRRRLRSGASQSSLKRARHTPARFVLQTSEADQTVGQVQAGGLHSENCGRCCKRPRKNDTAALRQLTRGSLSASVVVLGDGSVRISV